jgi:hypothetical protein
MSAINHNIKLDASTVSDEPRSSTRVDEVVFSTKIQSSSTDTEEVTLLSDLRGFSLQALDVISHKDEETGTCLVAVGGAAGLVRMMKVNLVQELVKNLIP